MAKNYSLKKWFFLILTVISFSLLVYNLIPQATEVPVNYSGELFEPQMLYLSSVSQFSKYIDTAYALKHGLSFDTTNYVDLVSNIVKKRFLFSVANYSAHENWIINSLGTLFWSHISAKVKPNDILQGYHGLCSQQTIVFMELLMSKGIKVRSVGLGFPEGPGHFLCEANYNGAWHLYDVTKEPAWERIGNKHYSMDFFLENKDSLFMIYDGKMKHNELEKIITNVKYGQINEFPAKRMLLLHKFCDMAVIVTPLFLLFLFIRERRNTAKK